MTRTTSRPWFRAVGAVAALALIALTGACSGNTKYQDPGTSGGNSGSAAAGTLTVASPYTTETLDPHGSGGVQSGTVVAAQAVFSRLVKADSSGKIVADLASDWSANDDATQWTFTLRDATFSDGTPVTAADVVYSFDRAIKLAGPVAGNFPGITAAAKDDHTVVFTSENPEAAMLGKLTFLFVVKQGATDDSFAKPIGSGPFLVSDFKPGDTVTFVPNPTYYGGEPKLSKLVMRTIPEVSARMTALQTGEIQATWGIPDDQIPALKDNSNLTVQMVPATSVITMWFNSSRPALQDPAVRNALWEAIDFKTIISTLYPETGALADSPVAKNVLGYAAQEAKPYDPQAAKAALEKAGFDFNQTLQWQFSGAEYRQFVQAAVSDLAKIGVKVEPQEKESAVFLDDLLALNWDINFQALSTPTFDAATNLGRLYTCDANRMGYCNKDLDSILSQAGSTPDESARKDLYAQADKIVWDDAVGMYPMFLNIAYAWTNNVKGLEPNPSFIPDFSQVTVS